MKQHLLKSVFAVFVGAALTITAFAAHHEKGEAYSVGDKVKAFTLTDAHGKTHDLSKYLGEDIVVLEFWNMGCPVSRAYMDRMKELHSEFDQKGVTFFAVDSNSTNQVADIKTFAEEKEMRYPVLKDWENKIADQFGANRTPEIIVIGIKYHGAVDDSQNESKVDNYYLKNALTALVNGEDVETRQTKAFGCAIKKVN